MNLNPIKAGKEVATDLRDRRALGGKTTEAMGERLTRNITVLTGEVLVAVAVVIGSIYAALKEPATFEERVREVIAERNYDPSLERFKYVKRITFLREAFAKGLFTNKEKVQELLNFLDTHGTVQVHDTILTNGEDRTILETLRIASTPGDVDVITSLPPTPTSSEIHHWVIAANMPYYDPKTSGIIFPTRDQGIDENETMLHLLIALSDARSHKQKGKVDYGDDAWSFGFISAPNKDDEAPAENPTKVKFDAVSKRADNFLVMAMTDYAKTKFDITADSLLRSFDKVVEGESKQSKASKTYLMVRSLLKFDKALTLFRLPGFSKFMELIRPTLTVMAENPSLISNHFDRK